MSERHAFANRYLKSVRKICQNDNIGLPEVHKILQMAGCKPIKGTNKYNEFETDKIFKYETNRIKSAYDKLCDNQSNTHTEEEYITQNDTPIEHKTNDSWRFNPSFASDMAQASDELLAQDDVYYGEHRPQFVRESKRKIFLSEAQIEALKNMIEESNSAYPVNPRKVEVVAKYLDNNFERGGISTFSEDGYPKTLCIVGMKGTDGKIARNMDAKQLFYLLQDKFKDIYLDKFIRDKFLKQVMKDWYDKKISKQHLLSVNVIK